MRMNAKTMQIVVDEIYKQVSEPIIEANNKALDGIKVKPDQYIKDREKYLKLKEQRDDIDKLMDELEKPYERNNTFNGYEFRSWSHPFGLDDYEKYIKHCKSQQVILKEVPSKDDIEKEIILAGNKDIPALIEMVVNKLK